MSNRNRFLLALMLAVGGMAGAVHARSHAPVAANVSLNPSSSLTHARDAGDDEESEEDYRLR